MYLWRQHSHRREVRLYKIPSIIRQEAIQLFNRSLLVQPAKETVVIPVGHQILALLNVRMDPAGASDLTLGLSMCLR